MIPQRRVCYLNCLCPCMYLFAIFFRILFVKASFLDLWYPETRLCWIVHAGASWSVFLKVSKTTTEIRCTNLLFIFICPILSPPPTRCTSHEAHSRTCQANSWLNQTTNIVITTGTTNPRAHYMKHYILLGKQKTISPCLYKKDSSVDAMRCALALRRSVVLDSRCSVRTLFLVIWRRLGALVLSADMGMVVLQYCHPVSHGCTVHGAHQPQPAFWMYRICADVVHTLVYWTSLISRTFTKA